MPSAVRPPWPRRNHMIVDQHVQCRQEGFQVCSHERPWMPSPMSGSTRHAAPVRVRNHSSREAPPQTVELLADLVFFVRLGDFEHAYAGTCGHVGGPPPPAAPKFRFASEPAVPL